uniref:hypothetical protein n=1 Tax=Crenothrix polyspora TaxID=360316 RepID=UPI0011786DCF
MNTEIDNLNNVVVRRSARPSANSGQTLKPPIKSIRPWLWLALLPASFTCNALSLPDLVSYSFVSQETKNLPGLSTEAACNGSISNDDQVGRLAVAALFFFNDCYTDGRFNNNDYLVERGVVSDTGNQLQIEAYKIHEPARKAAQFLASQHAVYYRFPTQEDYTVYLLDGNAVNKVVQVSAAQIDTNQFVKVDTLTASNIKGAVTYLFVPNSQRVSSFTELAPGIEGARVNKTALGDVLKYRYTVNGKPFDTKLDFDHGPNRFQNVYSLTRQFFLVLNSNGQPGMVWQDKEDDSVQVTWPSAELSTQETLDLPFSADADLAAAASDENGNVYYLMIQRGSGVNSAGEDTARIATLFKANPAGQELLRKTLDTSATGLNTVTFGNSNVASLTHSNGKLGLILGRQMHRTDDGLNHQGGIAAVFDANTLELVKNWGQTSGHSFENILTTNPNGEFVGVDLGDNFPRGVHLHKFTGNDKFSRVVYTYKTQHGTTAANPAGVSFPVYTEISNGGTTYYQWSNDNRTYTELGGVVPTPSGYTVVFAGEPAPDGRALDNARVGSFLNDPRNLGLIQVRPDFENASGASFANPSFVSDDLVKTIAPPETGGFYTFGGTRSEQRNTGVVWLTHYQEKNQENVSRLKTVKLNDGNLLLLWEKWTPDAYVNTYAMKVNEAGNPLTDAVELGTQVRLNRRDDILQMGNLVYLITGDKQERKLELTVLQLTAN